MSKDTNGPAFPVAGSEHNYPIEGMTLRDYFAAKALQGLISSHQAFPFGMNFDANEYARKAYRIASAMLEARQ